jgi:hypothetical protein
MKANFASFTKLFKRYETMDAVCEERLKMWLAEIEAPTPDPIQAAQAARALAACIGNYSHVQQLIQALRDKREDRISCERFQMRLPDYIYAQLQLEPDMPPESDHQDIRNHLALCPYCAVAYAEVTDWLLASQGDLVPVAAFYPAFEVPAATQPSAAASAPPPWSVEVVRRAFADKKQWVEDTLGGLYLLFGQGVQAQGAPGWALKSSEQSKMLAQTIVGDEQVEGWEIEATAFEDAQEAGLCRIEVALYRLDAPGVDLAGMAVTLRVGEAMQTRMTDESGVVEFEAIPLAELAHCAIRVTLPPTSSSD